MHFVHVYLNWFYKLNVCIALIGVVSLVEEIGLPSEYHRPAESQWQTLSHNDVSSTPCLSGNRAHNVSDDRQWLHR
jgi:hypothetical protein